MIKWLASLFGCKKCEYTKTCECTKVVAKKPATKKAPVKKPVAKKAPVKKAVAKKPVAKKVVKKK